MSAPLGRFTTTPFERLSSSLLAVAMGLSAVVGWMLLQWLASVQPVARQANAWPTIRSIAAGEVSIDRNFSAPTEAEQQPLGDPPVELMLETVQEVARTVARQTDSITFFDSPLSTHGETLVDRSPPTSGWLLGMGSEDILPRFKRWQLVFSAADRMAYAKQLDFYGIELAAVGGGVQGIDVAAAVSTDARFRRVDVNDPVARRLYFSWSNPTNRFAIWDDELLSQAGVRAGAERIRMQFIPPDLENELAHLELAYASKQGKQSVTEIAKTVFESIGSKGSYRFKVIEQRYRSEEGYRGE